MKERLEHGSGADFRFQLGSGSERFERFTSGSSGSRAVQNGPQAVLSGSRAVLSSLERFTNHLT